MNKTPIEFIVTHGILFACPQCNKPIKTDHHGPYHVSTGDHCPQCGVFYTVEWQTPIEHSHVEMVNVEVKE